MSDSVDRASLVALCALLVAILSTFADYGMSWDEPHSIAYGQRVVAFFASLGSDRSAAEGEVALRGGHFHALVEAVALLAPEDALLVRRLVTPLVGLLGVFGCWRLARALGGPLSGLLGVLLLALTPLYYGHMFINPADLPFAVGYVWAVHWAIRFVQELPRPRPWTVVAAGLVSGVSIGVRITGMLVLGYVIMLSGYALLEVRRGPRSELRASLVHAGAALLGLLMLSALAMIALWPAALLHPLAQPLHAVLEAVKFPKHEQVLYAGEAFYSDALPRSYQLGYLAVQLPEVMLLAYALGAVVSINALVGALRAHARERWALEAGVLIAGVAPLAFAFAMRPVDYDGVRHWLFVVPLLACSAARGLGWLFARCAGRRALQIALAALLALGLARNASALAALHPYEYTFYNAAVGGTRGASGRYELDYWITSFREAVELLSAQLVYAHPELAHATSPRLKLAVCGHAVVAAVYLPRFIELTRDADDADYVLATTKWACHARYPGRVVAEIGRAGALFAVVKRLR